MADIGLDLPRALSAMVVESFLAARASDSLLFSSTELAIINTVGETAVGFFLKNLLSGIW